jgi:hypothetical protein
VRSSLAALILFLCLAARQAHAVTVSVLNAQPDRCPEVTPLVADLNTVQFPGDWTVYIACDSGTWQDVLRKAEITQTAAALTVRAQKLTILNSSIYSSSFPFERYVQKTTQGVLRHELSHIMCNTGSEDVADHFADTGFCGTASSRKTEPQRRPQILSWVGLRRSAGERSAERIGDETHETLPGRPNNDFRQNLAGPICTGCAPFSGRTFGYHFQHCFAFSNCAEW